MSIAQVLAGLTSAMESTKSDLASVNMRIEELAAERQRVTAAAPHTDDIVAVFLRGLQTNAGEFTRQLGSHLNEHYTGDGAASAAGRGNSAQLLTFEAHKPDREEVLTRSMRGEAAGLNAVALTYFLREQIAKEIPSLVAKLCPAAQQGMKQSDRDAALAALNAELRELEDRRDQLTADLAAARQAVAR